MSQSLNFTTYQIIINRKCLLFLQKTKLMKESTEDDDAKRIRYITSQVKNEMDQRDSFECAWCGVKLTERHHIIEFHAGGENTTENLILLCPTCHSEVHKKDGNIKENELILRKSIHSKGDRITGNLPFDAPTSKIMAGQLAIVNHNHLIAFNTEPVFTVEKHGDAFVISCRFYNNKGDLIFWMSKNRYWSISDFDVSVNKKSLTIFNPETENNYIKIEQIEDYFKVNFKNYYEGAVVEFGDNGIEVSGKGFMKFQGEGIFDANGKGFINL